MDITIEGIQELVSEVDEELDDIRPRNPNIEHQVAKAQEKLSEVYYHLGELEEDFK